MTLQAKLHNLESLASWGAKFVRIAPNSKHPTDANWPEKPLFLETATAHARWGGNVGLLTGEPSKGLVVLDIDAGYQEIYDTFPKLALTPTISRQNAPDRAKLLLKITGELPPNRSWKGKTFEIDLLSTGRQAIIHGLHESGVAYELHNDHLPPLELASRELAILWRFLTGEELYKQATPKPYSYMKETPFPPAPDSLVAKVKAHFTAYDIFEKFGLAKQVESEAGNQWRLRHNGGLIVGDGDEAWRWYCFQDEQGGDQVDAWGWCRFGTSWDRHDKAMFRQVLEEMAEEARLETEKREAGHLDLEHLKHLAMDFDWPSRTRETDRSVYLELIYLAEERKSLEVAVGCRELAERAGVCFRTASKALHRLQKYGLIHRKAKSDRFHPDVWEIPSQNAHLTPADGKCAPSLAIHELNGDDAFLWGSKVDRQKAQEGESLDCIGPTGKSFIAVLSAENDLSISEIAEKTGMHPATASKKAKVLASLGLVKLKRLGRSLVVHLKGHWRTLLDSLRRRLTTFGRSLQRKISHLQSRERHCEWLLAHLPTRLREFRQEIQQTMHRAASRWHALEAELLALAV